MYFYSVEKCKNPHSAHRQQQHLACPVRCLSQSLLGCAASGAALAIMSARCDRLILCVLFNRSSVKQEVCRVLTSTDERRPLAECLQLQTDQLRARLLLSAPLPRIEMQPLPPQPAPASATAVPPVPPGIHCFAFGANMSPTTLAKRGVRPLASQPALLADVGMQLSFSHRGGYATLLHLGAGRPHFSVPAAGPAWRQPHGVLHTLTPADFQKLAAREVGYRQVRILARTYDGRPVPDALAFVSSPLLCLYQPVAPPRRYLDLLLEGACHHGLDADYVAWLEGLEAAPPGPLDGRYDACPANSLAKLMAAGMAGAAAVAAARM